MKKQIILDLDDVQADLFSDLRKHLNAYTGINKKVSDFVSFDVTQVYPGLVLEEFFSVLKDNQVIESLSPIEGAVEATHLLREKGYEVNVVTARSWHGDGYKASLDWLQTHGFHFDRLSISNHSLSKAEIYKSFSSEFAVIIDDHIKNIDQAIATGMFESVALIDKPWNSSDTRFVEGESRYESLLDVALELQDVA